MRVPIPIKCPSCGLQNDIFIRLDEQQVRGECGCGQDLFGILAQIYIGYKILQKSRYEYRTNSDYSLSIVFAAMALECDLARLYSKWRRIELIPSHAFPTEQDIESEWRALGGIQARIEATVRHMYAGGLEAFVRKNQELLEMIKKGFPNLDIDKLGMSFQQAIFWPRNRILHFGYAAYGIADATLVYNTARLGLIILEQLDQHRRATT